MLLQTFHTVLEHALILFLFCSSSNPNPSRKMVRRCAQGRGQGWGRGGGSPPSRRMIWLAHRLQGPELLSETFILLTGFLASGLEVLQPAPSFLAGRLYHLELQPQLRIVLQQQFQLQSSTLRSVHDHDAPGWDMSNKETCC